MTPIGLRIGYFSPKKEFGGAEQVVCSRIREICGPTSEAFPFTLSPLRDEKKQTVLSYGIIRGHVPVHVDRPNAAESCSSVFTFVLEAENRPVLLFAPAGREQAECIFLPDEAQAPRMALGAVELWPGRALHFDIARAFHGISGFPTGDLVPELPSAVVIQVPWARSDDIGGALAAMKRGMSRDDRFADLFAPAEEGGS